MEDYQEFLSRLQKRGPRTHTIRHCLGSRDAFHWVRKNKWEALDGKHCDKLLYSRIISEVNKILAEQLLEGHRIEFPYQMGELVLNKTPNKVYFDENDEVKNTYGVDWKRTLEYWYENPEAADTHIPLKLIQKHRCFIRYYKRNAHFKNRLFYSFRTSKTLLKRMGKMIRTRKINAEILE